MGDFEVTTKGQPGIASAALFGLCPRCGAKSLFRNLLEFAAECPSCKLDYAAFNVGDGAAAFLTMIIGAVVIPLAIWLEVTFHPPVWVHAVIWVPFTVALAVWGLRMAKAALLAIEFRTGAGEGRIKP
jgi:uncharacterized protein (DUF983 family)